MARKGWCESCCSIISFTGLTTLITWIILTTAHTPKLSLLLLHLPALNTSGQNTTLNFKLKLDNPNLGIGVYYSSLMTSFHYPANQSSTVADVTVPGFYQGHRKKAVKTGTGETRGVNWTEVAAAAEINGTAPFRVHVNGVVRFKYIWWRSKRRRVSVEGVVGVDTQGIYETEYGARLKSGATTRVPDMGGCLLLMLLILSNLGFTGFVC